MQMDEWRRLAERLVENRVDFVIPPSLRFVGEPGEQATLFFRDPSGNPIEIKGFAKLDDVYEK